MSGPASPRGYGYVLELSVKVAGLGAGSCSVGIFGGRLGLARYPLWLPEGSLAGFLGCVFEVLPAPGAREGLQKGGGARG